MEQHTCFFWLRLFKQMQVSSFERNSKHKCFLRCPTCKKPRSSYWYPEIQTWGSSPDKKELASVVSTYPYCKVQFVLHNLAPTAKIHDHHQLYLLCCLGVHKAAVSVIPYKLGSSAVTAFPYHLHSFPFIIFFFL